MYHIPYHMVTIVVIVVAPPFAQFRPYVGVDVGIY
jgi:hypothetical protein